MPAFFIATGVGTGYSGGRADSFVVARQLFLPTGDCPPWKGGLFSMRQRPISRRLPFVVLGRVVVRQNMLYYKICGWMWVEFLLGRANRVGCMPKERERKSCQGYFINGYASAKNKDQKKK